MVILEVLGSALFIALAYMWAIMNRQLSYARRHDKAPQLTGTKNMKNLLSVSVCIPARNEMGVMTECLQSVLASTYPKLEILVLDDRSEDTTSTLVKAFAHDGVRFIEGSPLPEGWLGKNYALQGLLNEASGTYVLFMDVDTRLQPGSIEQLVSYAQATQAKMVSTLPQRQSAWNGATVFAPLRYFISIIFQRKAAPAVASAAWLIERDALLGEHEGFTHLKQTIQPEATLATQFAASGQYRFTISSSALGVSYTKGWQAQLRTSVRLLYPLLGARWWKAAAAVVDIAILLLPYAVVVATLWTGWGTLQTVCVIIIVLYTVLYGRYLHRVWGGLGWVTGVLWPLLLIQEAILIIVSGIRYTQGTVTWKGRPVSLK